MLAYFWILVKKNVAFFFINFVFGIICRIMEKNVWFCPLENIFGFYLINLINDYTLKLKLCEFQSAPIMRLLCCSLVELRKEMQSPLNKLKYDIIGNSKYSIYKLYTGKYYSSKSIRGKCEFMSELVRDGFHTEKPY